MKVRPHPRGNSSVMTIDEPETGKQPLVLLVDFTSLRMRHLLSAMETPAFLIERRRPCSELADAVLRPLPGDRLLEPDESASKFRDWLGLIEDRMQAICRTESKQFWLHLSRRIRPEPETLGVTPETAWLARVTLNLAILKYGQPEGRVFVKVASGTDLHDWVMGDDDAEIEESEIPAGPLSLVPKTLTTDDCVAMHQLEELAYEFCRVATGLRRAWKGGRLRLVDGVPQAVELDPDTEYLVGLYDMRMAKYNTILSSFGLVANLGYVLEQHSEGAPVDAAWILWLPIWNLEGLDVVSLFDKRADTPFVSNYLLFPVSVEPWYRSASLFNEEIEKIWDISSEQIVSFLVASSQRHVLITRDDVRLKYQLWQRGYVVIQADEYAGQVVEAYQACCAELFGREVSIPDAANEAKHILKALTYGEADLAEIDLWTRSGTKVLHPMGDGLHIDYSMVPAFLAQVLKAIPMTGGAVGEAKGLAFEEQAKRVIQEHTSDVEFWATLNELEFDDGSRRELDLGVLKGETMLVCECKSHVVPPAFERGEPDEIWNREQQLRSAFKKADTLAQKLAQSAKGRNFTLPEEVKSLIPCVLTPFPEYLPERNSTFFFDNDNRPRICVPEELAEFLREPTQPDEPAQNFCYKVNRDAG